MALFCAIMQGQLYANAGEITLVKVGDSMNGGGVSLTQGTGALRENTVINVGLDGKTTVVEGKIFQANGDSRFEIEAVNGKQV